MEKSYWRDAYDLFCERYRSTISARNSEIEAFGGSATEHQALKLSKVLTPADTPHTTRRRKTSEQQLIQTTVIQGTQLLALPKKADPPQSPSLHFPKLSPDQRLQQLLRRKKLITGLTPRICRKHTLLAFSAEAEKTASLSSTAKTLKAKDVDTPSDCTPKALIKVREGHRKRVSGSQSPERTATDSEKPENAARRSVELGVVKELPRPRTIETKGEKGQSDAEDLNSSGLLMTRKMALSIQVRSSFGSVPIETPHSPPKPAVPKPAVPKRRTKAVTVSVEIKPTAEQQTQIAAALYADFSHCIRTSNGLTPLLPDSPYKVYIGQWNNSQLIAAVMKKRWFWARVDTWQQADFVWTANKQSAIVERLEKAPESPIIATLPTATRPRAATHYSKVMKTLIETERSKSGFRLISESESFAAVRSAQCSAPMRLYNRIERNYQLTSKKRLFVNMRNYYQNRGENVFSYLPLTFLVQAGSGDPEFARFAQSFREGELQKAKKDKPKYHNLWIVKPGENTNCGHGIHVSSSLEEIKAIVNTTVTSSGRKRTYVVQKYIEKPLLVHKRKFDIRCYGLVTCVNGHTQGYFYHDGYLRTSSKEFSLKNATNRFVSLTNDAVQKKSEDYGKYESGNKLSYEEFQKYLEATTGGKVDFWRDIWTQIKKLMTDTFRAVSTRLDPHRRRHTFEILGYDFMVDCSYRVWLIEVNTNPCLALSSPYLARLIPTMVDNAFRIALDPYFLEPANKRRQKEWETVAFENRFEVVFSSLKDDVRAAADQDQISVESDESSDSDSNEAN